MKLVITLALACAAYAQDAPPVNQIDGPAGGPAEQTVYVINGSNQTVGICWALSGDPTGSRSFRQVAISAISKANPGVITSVAHGIHASARPNVTISGATGTGWVSGATTVNGTFVATVIDADTFSIPVNTTGNGTLGGTVVFTTTGPRTVYAEWAVYKIAYDGSGNAIWKGWLNGKRSFDSKCSDATSTSIQQQ